MVAPQSGVVSHIDARRAGRDVARQADCSLELVPALGEFVPAGAPLFAVARRAPSICTTTTSRTLVVLGLERTLDQDVAYGLRLLVDIAERSLADSPFLDPTTAVQAIDRLHDCLRQLARRPFPDGEHGDADGTVRLVVPSMDWDAYVHLAFDEIRIAGAGSPQVTRRLHAALDDLLTIAPPDRRPVLQRQLEQLYELTAEVMRDEADARMASTDDRQGIGVKAGRRAV